jgi:hypothetical protein
MGVGRDSQEGIQRTKRLLEDKAVNRKVSGRPVIDLIDPFPLSF